MEPGKFRLCPHCTGRSIVGSALGLGLPSPFESYVAKGVQALLRIAIIGQLVAVARACAGKRLWDLLRPSGDSHFFGCALLS